MWEDIFIFVASSQENDSQVLGFFLELFVMVIILLYLSIWLYMKPFLHVFGWCEDWCRSGMQSVGLVYRVVASVFCGVMYTVVSRKLTCLVECVISNLIVGCTELRCLINV